MRVRIVQREQIAPWHAALIRIGAIFFALVLAAVLLAVMGYNPIEAYGAMLNGAFGSANSLKSTITTAVPLVIITLGISIAFSMNFVNVGGEGQLLAGAVGATFIAHNLPMSLPTPVMLLLMAVASMLMGALLGAIPAFFKAKFKVNETLFTLMLNYVMQYFVLMLRSQTWKDPKAMGFPKIAAVPARHAAENRRFAYRLDNCSDSGCGGLYFDAKNKDRLRNARSRCQREYRSLCRYEC